MIEHEQPGAPNPATRAGPRFPAGARQTAIPSLFFSDVLPSIEDPVELIVSTYAFYLLGRKPAAARWFIEDELRAESPLRRSLGRLGADAAQPLARGLDAAVDRGTLLRAESLRDGRTVRLYAANVPGGAQALARAGAEVTAARQAEGVDGLAGTPPNIFLLYEENVGVISPLLAEQLAQAEGEYPWPWIVAAFREAVALNRRSWRYIERILERWRTEGPDLEAIRRSVAGARGRDLAGRYWRLVKR
ncbi:MAG: DnaD domain-containing protein [Dehalococcoidia bacterium]